MDIFSVIFGVTPIILFEYLMIRGDVNKWVCSLYTFSHLCKSFSPPLFLGFDLSRILFPFPLGESRVSRV